MEEEDLKRTIDEFMDRIRRELPDSPETEDLLEDLYTHIRDSLNDRMEAWPDEDPSVLLREVLEDLGTPEEIAAEFGQLELAPAQEEGAFRGRQLVLRLVVAVLVAVLASALVSTMTNNRVDFVQAVVVLLAFAVAEWFIRAWQLSQSPTVCAGPGDRL